MRTEARLVRLLWPFKGLYLLGAFTAVLASVLDGVTLVILIPLLTHLFGTAGAIHTGSTQLEHWLNNLTAPLLVGTTPGQAVGRMVLLLAAGLLLKNAASYAASQISVRVQEGIVRDLRAKLFAHLLTVDLDFFQRTRAGQLIAGLITEVDQVKFVVTASLSSFVQNLALVLTTLILLTQVSWRLTLLTLACAPLLLIGVRLLLTRLRGHARERAEERGEITATAAERLGAIRLIRAYGAEAREAARFRAQADRYRKQVIRTQRYASLTSPVSEIFGAGIVVLILWAATRPGLIGLSGPLAPSVVIFFLMAALKMMSPLKTLTNVPAVFAIALASADRVFSFLDQPSAEQPVPGEREATFRDGIVFENVSFAYANEEPVLRNVSFGVPRGRAVAVVGPSGAGKTTLLELLPRFAEPTGGRILLDGVPLSQCTRQSVRALMGLVGQETVLLNDTVRANIAYGRPDATQEQIEAAAAAANAVEFIAGLPLGYETMLGEDGNRLSGGQRQRIAIARALLRDPPILILDEATSSLDPESERLVQQAIDRLMEDRTVLVVAHRLATVRHADEILVLDEGRIVERGSHDELYRAGGLYRRLYDLQFRNEPAGEEPVTV